MRKLFLASAGLFIAATAQADTPPASAPAAPATPMVTTGDVVTTAPARRGLFSRLRNRTNRSTPVSYAAPMTTTATPATPATPAPTPMPMGKVSSAPMTTPMTGVVQASGTTTTTMPATGTAAPCPCTTPMTTTSRPMRTGLFRRS